MCVNKNAYKTEHFLIFKFCPRVRLREIKKCPILGHFSIFGAEDEIRTRDICLGKATLYH